MPSQKPSKVIIDTNIWISFLIGKELKGLKDIIVQDKIKLIITEQLISEIKSGFIILEDVFPYRNFSGYRFYKANGINSRVHQLTNYHSITLLAIINRLL